MLRSLDLLKLTLCITTFTVLDIFVANIIYREIIMGKKLYVQIKKILKKFEPRKYSRNCTYETFLAQ